MLHSFHKMQCISMLYKAYIKLLELASSKTAETIKEQGPFMKI